ncbi:MAG: tRNA (N(6)-L-threonylcarbamoyladenosine(37)-C(2))-methylthiotransferase MtaB [Clostridia bacterium]|nr:tRNA (N(6)-L-threonylcarbamoyladenosine(37)-C(2))-methylthiotransferase MtaB [Clostridia bacterium]
MNTIAFYTLGCKANQAETAAMEQLAAEAGCTVVPFGNPADITVINSCTVTQTADKKSRQVLRRARALSPDGIVAVCGCYAQREAKSLVAEGLADIAHGNRDHAAFLSAAISAAASRARSFYHTEDTVFRPLPAAVLAGRTRALLKVQDGCEMHCSYCIIPHMRGKNRCISPSEAEAQARAAYNAGAKELVLTGIEVSSYRYTENGEVTTFAGLVRRICLAAPEMRIRLGSLEPRLVDAEFCRLSELPNLCPHFHLSLQSGSDETLRRIRRQYNTARYARALTDLRAAFPDVCITTDLICGFPGETEEEFERSLSFVTACRFLKVHIFPYSRRTGTEAASLPDQILRTEKEDRCRRAAAACAAVTEELLASYIGRTLPVLCEDSPGEGLMQGYAPNYIPVTFPGGEKLHNSVQSVRITAVSGECLRGEAVL